MEEYKTRMGGDSVRQKPYKKLGTVNLLHKKDDRGFVTYFCTYPKCAFSSADRKEAREHYKGHYAKARMV